MSEEYETWMDEESANLGKALRAIFSRYDAFFMDGDTRKALQAWLDDQPALPEDGT